MAKGMGLVHKILTDGDVFLLDIEAIKCHIVSFYKKLFKEEYS